jgi:hypothetical protein
MVPLLQTVSRLHGQEITTSETLSEDTMLSTTGLSQPTLKNLALPTITATVFFV